MEINNKVRNIKLQIDGRVIEVKTSKVEYSIKAPKTYTIEHREKWFANKIRAEIRKNGYCDLKLEDKNYIFSYKIFSITEAVNKSGLHMMEIYSYLNTEIKKMYELKIDKLFDEHDFKKDLLDYRIPLSRMICQPIIKTPFQKEDLCLKFFYKKDNK